MTILPFTAHAGSASSADTGSGDPAAPRASASPGRSAGRRAAVPRLPDTLCPDRVLVGGACKLDLLGRLLCLHVRLNPLAMELFDSPRFGTASQARGLDLALRSVGSLGFAQGATMPALLARAAEEGLRPCPVETGPHLRLQWTTQAEGAIGQVQTRGCAPPGSLTIVSLPLGAPDAVPAGFYLRRIEGALWLRGYRSDDVHTWGPGDQLVFCR